LNQKSNLNNLVNATQGRNEFENAIKFKHFANARLFNALDDAKHQHFMGLLDLAE
jgi:hypothetical protein